ncbi:hypothetical protein F2Q68_00006852 [Brassica cretica]|uniref:Uncharacterized protein n=1 Tax=Brassica cretica TaxID=69181 RepID=A0A8S9JKF8_BRACR|nr:hypothetical protein F2Q68_00006852 [Brassica cretica]
MARSGEATARSDEATARSDEATAKSDDDDELKRTSRQKLKRIDDNKNNINLSYVSPSKLNFGTKELPCMVSVQSTERVEAIYPLLKDVALSPDMPGGSNAMKQMFTFALRSARNGIVTRNPVLAEEATSIAI